MAAPITTPRFQARVDIIPMVLEFLSGLRADDILTELVQNDLDQGASETHIRFSRSGLVAEGNGRPVDARGWKRLGYLLGAGGEVEAKRDGIGAKNHGLRSCFALGDEIVVRSAGQQTRLTLRAGGGRTRLDPGAWEHPLPDAEAPRTGARIEVSFRTKPLLRHTGEDTGLLVPTLEEAERLFAVTLAQAPMRYLGCVRPQMITRYVLTVEHWRIGTCGFVYTCGPLRKKGRFRAFRRRCEATMPDGRQEVYEEEAVLFSPRVRVGAGNVPRYYRRASGLLCEVSWRTGARGQPAPYPGRLRYPIAYAADAANARTELGASFSAPFVSDTARHGLALGVQSQNDPLVEECEQLLVRLLREYLIPTYGVAALAVLDDPEHPASERSARLVLEAAASGALPAAPRASPRRPRARTSRGAARPKVRCVPAPAGGQRSFVIPVYREDASGSPSPLPQLAPVDCAQLHPGVPGFVRTTLLKHAATATEGLRYSTFDEHDVIARLRGRPDGRFPWASEDDRRHELEDPARARLYLDVLARALETGSITSPTAVEVCRDGELPDRASKLQPWGLLWRHRHEVPEIPGVQAPQCVHPLLVDHPVLGRGKLRIGKFELSDYLAQVDFSAAGTSAREAFFQWLTRNEKQVSGETLETLAHQPIWPTTEGAQVSFAELCALEPTLRRVLAGYLHHPAPAVLSLRRVRTDGRGLLRLRRRPTPDELRAWWDSSIIRFPHDRVLSSEERDAWRALERDLACLWADAQIRSELTWLGPVTPVLCADGHLKPAGALHLANRHVDACRLLPEDRLEGGSADLYEALGARTRPGADAIVRALAEDADPELLHVRLAALAEARKRGDVATLEVETIPFIEVDGTRYPPRRVALRSNRDFWGAWRIPYAADQLSPERQAHLRAVGVAGRFPERHTSRLFFEWLATQSESVLRQHLDPIVRHLLHEQGPLSWWETYPGVPCLPVQTYGREVRLISRREALNPSNPALLPDFAELERRILAHDRRLRIVVVETPGVSDSAFSKLRGEGLKSLRQTAGSPTEVRSESAGVRHEALTARLAVVASERFAADFRKRLQELHVDRGVVRHRWLHEVRLLREVRLAPGVEACFRVGRRDYWLRTDGAADAERGIIWVSSDAASAAEAFYSALAERIFDPDSPPYLAFALQSAASAGYQARFDSRGSGRAPLLEDEPGGETASPEEKADPGAGGKSADVRKAHNVGHADDMPNRPSPGPITQHASSSGGTTQARRRRRRGSARAESPEERAAIDELKEKHYVWHCQVCLASAEPSRLAPPGSYAFRPVHRRAFAVGHHVDPVQGEGVRWVSNILILCEHHHRHLGDRLEHPALVQALHAGKARSVEFVDGDGVRSRVGGIVVTVSIDGEPWNASVFFTAPHAEAWMAPPSAHP